MNDLTRVLKVVEEHNSTADLHEWDTTFPVCYKKSYQALLEGYMEGTYIQG